MFANRASAADPLKVGYIYVGPINDGGWNTAHEAGRQAMLKALGDKVTSVYVENVAEGPDSERVMRDLVNQGCKLILRDVGRLQRLRPQGGAGVPGCEG